MANPVDAVTSSFQSLAVNEYKQLNVRQKRWYSLQVTLHSLPAEVITLISDYAPFAASTRINQMAADYISRTIVPGDTHTASKIQQAYEYLETFVRFTQSIAVYAASLTPESAEQVAKCVRPLHSALAFEITGSVVEIGAIQTFLKALQTKDPLLRRSFQFSKLEYCTFSESLLKRLLAPQDESPILQHLTQLSTLTAICNPAGKTTLPLGKLTTKITSLQTIILHSCSNTPAEVATLLRTELLSDVSRVQIQVRANWTGTLDYEIALSHHRTTKRIGWGNDESSGEITIDRAPDVSFYFAAALLHHPLVKGTAMGPAKTITYSIASTLSHADFLECCLELFRQKSLNGGEAYAILETLLIWIHKPGTNAMLHRKAILKVVEATQVCPLPIIRLATRIRVAISPLRLPQS